MQPKAEFICITLVTGETSTNRPTRFALICQTGLANERCNLRKIDKYVIGFFFILIRIDEAAIGDGGDAHLRGFGGGDAGE